MASFIKGCLPTNKWGNDTIQDFNLRRSDHSYVHNSEGDPSTRWFEYEANMLRGEKCRKHHYCLFGVNEIQQNNFSKTMAWSNVSTSAGKKLWIICVKAILQAFSLLLVWKLCLQLRHLASEQSAAAAIAIELSPHSSHIMADIQVMLLFSLASVIEKTPSPFFKTVSKSHLSINF